MSQHEHDAGHASPIKTRKPLITVIALALLAAILIVVMLSQFISNMRSVDKDSPAMTPEAVAKRLKPVGDVAFADTGGAAETGAAPGAAAGKADGKKIYEANCSACHGSGVAGAPKAGDKAAWAPRLKAGMNALYASSIKGKGAMPAKGGNTALADADVKAAVDYLMGLAK
ncbi:MAG: cytochrome c5 family protein [Betaproteobacteria bacterium]|nr:cytochrome c5 family protein [Betaproteobacteria bacterium]